MEIAAWANRCYIITPHQIRRFPARVDFRTSAGFMNGGEERKILGLRGKGPQAVVTNLGVLEPNENGELILAALHPGSSVEKVKENTGWDLKVSDALRLTEVTHKQRIENPQGRA